MALINISIDLTKINKDKIKHHVNGAKYYQITVSELANVDDYENTHTVYDRQSKQEQADKVPRNYLGKGKEIKFTGTTATGDAGANSNQDQDDDLPF